MVTVTSDEWDDLNYSTTGYWVHSGDNWIVITSDVTEGVISIWKWPRGGEIELVTKSGPREGITAVSAVALVPGSPYLSLRCTMTGRIFRVDPSSSEPGFERVYYAEDLAGDMVFWDRERLIGGANALTVKHYAGKPELGFLPRLNALLPDDRNHPSKRSTATHQLKMIRRGDRLVLGFVLYPEYLDFTRADAVTRKVEPIRCKGYIEPPKTYIDKFTNEGDLAYFGSFHHLSELSWMGETPFAKMKKGFTTYGIWLDLENPQSLTWDNEIREEKIFAVHENDIVMARISENEGGLVTCSLWRRSSLPTH
jgi:hypothetical protein